MGTFLIYNKWMKVPFFIIMLPVLLASCSPSSNSTNSPAPTQARQPTSTDIPVQKASEVPPSETSTARPTLTAWEEVQKRVQQFRRKLDQGSEGMEGIQIALEQDEANQFWCQGLVSAITDLQYSGDLEDADSIRLIMSEEGCE